MSDEATGFAPPPSSPQRPVPGPGWRWALRAFPRRFREAHGRDLIELYRDYAAAGRQPGRLAALWDLLRNGLGTRLDDIRPSGSPQPPRLPRKRKGLMDSLRQDLKFALRMLRKSPAFTAVAVVSLAIGIGANTAVFGLLDAAFWRPLAVAEPYELVVLGWRSPAGTEMPDISTWGWLLRDDNGDGLGSSYSVSAFEAFRERADVLDAAFAFADIGQVNVNRDERSEMASAQAVSGNYHAALGIEPAAGRLLVAADDRADAEPIVVLSHAYWQRRFGGDPGIVGATVRMNNEPFTVVGVTPPAFRGTLQVDDNPELTLPIAHQPLVATSDRDMRQPTLWWLHVMGRLRRGVSLEAAEEQLEAAFHGSVSGDLFADGVPPQYTLPGLDLRPGFQGMTEQRGLMATSLHVMAGVVAVVLLIACVNVANLLVARAGNRRREIAIRQSVGAGRGQLVRQLVAESVVLSTLSGAVGVALAVGGREALVGAMSARNLYVAGVRTDARVLGFGLLVSLVTGIAFGLVPALRASRPELTRALREGTGEAGRGQSGVWGLRLLLVTQTALSVMLLVVAGLFVRTLVNLERQATGFDPAGVALLRVNPGLDGYAGEREVSLYDELRARLARLPGAAAATVTSHSPVSGRFSSTTLQLAGYQPAEGERMTVVYNFIAPDFFATFDIPVLAGRGIVGADRDGAPMVAVVNRTLAERFFPGVSPIGRRLGLGSGADPGEYEIVGVAADVKYQHLSDEQLPVVHVALAQHAGSNPMQPMTLAVRTDGDAAEAIAAGRRIVREIDADIPVFDARTLAEQQATTLQMERLFARLSVILGALALGLACIGLYGMLSYGIVRRTREFGVRMALGARATDIVRGVMRELATVVVGIVVGIGLALMATRWIEGMVYGLPTTDPLSYATAIALLLLVAALAAFLPARRAASVDPVVALRFD